MCFYATLLWRAITKGFLQGRRWCPEREEGNKVKEGGHDERAAEGGNGGKKPRHKKKAQIDQNTRTGAGKTLSAEKRI